MKRIIYTTTLALSLLPSVMIAQESKMSLEDCIEYALIHQAKMKNALLDQKYWDAKNKEITGIALPNIKAGSSINYAPLVAAFQVPNFIKYGVTGVVKESSIDQQKFANTPDNISLAFQPKWTTSPQVEASQILFDPGVMVALQARKRIQEMALQNVMLTEQQTKVAVTKAYYNILIVDKRKALIDQNVLRIEQLEKETKAIHDAGFAEQIDVDRVTIALTNLRTEHTHIQQLLDLTYMALKFQIGMPIDDTITLTDTLSESYIDHEILTHEFDYNKRIEFRLLETQNKLYSSDVKRYKLGGLPTLVLYGNYGFTLYDGKKLFDPSDKWQKSALVGAKLSIPIFDGFQRRGKMLQAKYTLEKNKNDMENLKYALELEKENARISYQANISALKNQRSNMKLATDVYNTAKIKYKEGIGSSLEVMDAESALKEAQTNFFSALFDAVNAKIDLQKALGELQ